MIWICEYCGAEIESRRKLYKHKRDEHNNTKEKIEEAKRFIDLE